MRAQSREDWCQFVEEKRSLHFVDVFSGNLSSPSSPRTSVIQRDHFLIASPSRAQDLPDLFLRSRDGRKCLVLLPAGTEAEQQVLLSCLPKEPPEGAVLVVFTSGTSGEPKAVFHSVEGLLQTAVETQSLLEPFEFPLVLLAPWSMAGVAFHYLARCKDRKRSGVADESPLFWKLPLPPRSKEGPDLIVGSPFLLDCLLRKQSWQGTFFSFTAPLKPSLRAKAEAAGITLVEGYGLTELGGPVILNGSSIGPQLQSTDEGELVIESKRVAVGFYGGSSYSAMGRSPLLTGDIFSRDENGWKWLTRKKEWLDLGTRKVAPGLIESIVEGFPEVESCLVQIASDGKGWRICVHGSELGHSLGSAFLPTIQSRAHKSLSVDLRPRVWREVEELPRLSSGKAKRWISSMDEP